MLAASGAAVGLGNIWKFPFEVAEGGGAIFLFIYLFFNFAVCLPIMIAEIAVGRATNRNTVGAFKVLGHRQWNFIGKLGVLSAVLIFSFYNVVAGWSFGYFLEMLQGNFSVGDNFNAYINDIDRMLLYTFFFMLLSGYFVSRGVSNGIELLSRVLMPFLLLIVFCLIIYGLTLPHATKGLAFYLVPDFSSINLSTIYNALGQSFFSLSLGLGAMMTYGSYLSKSENILSSAFFVSLADVGVALLAGFMIFPFVAYMNAGEMQNITGGPSLIFITLPGVFDSLGAVTGQWVGAAFFLLLSVAALTSTVSLLEIPVAYLVDERGMKRWLATSLCCLLIFLLGIPALLSFGTSPFLTEFVTYFGGETPTSYMTLIEHISSDTLLPFTGLMLSIFVIYKWKRHDFSNEVSMGAPQFHGSFYERYVHFSLSYVCPVVLGLVFLLTVLDRFLGVSLF